MRANRIGLLAILLLGACGMSGCGTQFPVDAPTWGGLVVANDGPISVGTGDVKAPKDGMATSYYLYIPYVVSFAWGDSSLDTASRQGGISEVAYSDSDNLFILLWGRRRTVVHGR